MIIEMLRILKVIALSPKMLGEGSPRATGSPTRRWSTIHFSGPNYMVDPQMIQGGPNPNQEVERIREMYILKIDKPHWAKRFRLTQSCAS
jgi:hypothetical protein